MKKRERQRERASCRHHHHRRFFFVAGWCYSSLLRDAATCAVIITLFSLCGGHERPGCAPLLLPHFLFFLFFLFLLLLLLLLLQHAFPHSASSSTPPPLRLFPSSGRNTRDRLKHGPAGSEGPADPSSETKMGEGTQRAQPFRRPSNEGAMDREAVRRTDP